MSARITGRPLLPDNPKINFPHKEYEDHVKVIDMSFKVAPSQTVYFIVVSYFQRYPEEAELLNKDIFNFECMKCVWGPIPELRMSRDNVASVRGDASSKKVSEDDDDFMPSKQAQNKRKTHVASEKGDGSSSKVKSDDDDFMPSKKAQNRSKGCASSKSGRSSNNVA